MKISTIKYKNLNQIKEKQCVSFLEVNVKKGGIFQRNTPREVAFGILI
jgi:hypothetical protein